MTSSPERIAVAAGRAVYQQADRADRAFLVLRGSVAITGDVLPLGLCEVGDVFGELALVDDSPRPSSAVAMSDCELLAFTSEHLTERLVGTDPVLRVALGALIGRYSAMATALGETAAPPRTRPAWTRLAAAAREILDFETQLRTALATDQLVVHFQPIVALATGQLAGFEALVRWQHPRRGLLYPDAFVPFAEKSGMVTAVTDFCLRRVGALFPAIQAAARAGPAPLFVSINVSRNDLAQEAFAAKAVTLLGEAGLDPEHVTLEVTESVVMDDLDHCIRTLRNCRDQGFSIAIDDFGTGYSSLHCLGALPVTVLKIDRSFSLSLEADAPARMIAQAILQLGRDLGLAVVTEGIETVAQRDLLRTMGCALGQGFLFGAARDQIGTIALVEAWATAPSGPVLSPAA